MCKISLVINFFSFFLPKYPKLYNDSRVYVLKIALMLQSSFLSHSWVLGCKFCLSLRAMGVLSLHLYYRSLYLLQSVAHFPSGKAGGYSDWRQRLAGDVFCFEKVCFLLRGTALLLGGYRGIAVHLQSPAAGCAWTSPPTAYCVYCGTRQWPTFLLCCDSPVGLTLLVQQFRFPVSFCYPLCFFPCITFLLQLSLFHLLASPFLSKCQK